MISIRRRSLFIFFFSRSLCKFILVIFKVWFNLKALVIDISYILSKTEKSTFEIFVNWLYASQDTMLNASGGWFHR